MKTRIKNSVALSISLWCILLAAFLCGCENDSPTGPSFTETPHVTISPTPTSPSIPTPTPAPPSFTSTPSPRPTHTPRPTATPDQTRHYHGDSYWGDFETRVGPMNFTLAPNGTIEGTIRIYAYREDPLAEDYVDIDFTTQRLPNGGFYRKFVGGCIHLGIIHWELACDSLDENAEGTWYYSDERTGRWRGEGTWRVSSK